MKNFQHRTRETPIRKCLVTGLTLEKKDLIRFVLDPHNNLIIDIEQTLPGRGYWVKADRSTLLKAIQKKVFFKLIKERITITTDVLEMIEIQTKQKIIQHISLSRKAGQTIFGLDKIKALLKNKPINLLIQATDGSSRERSRLSSKCVTTILDNCLTGSELGRIFGREKVVHCAILGGGFTEKIIFNANRLNNLKNPVPHYRCIENNVESSLKH